MHIHRALPHLDDQQSQKECCAKSRYQGQGQVITSQSTCICGISWWRHQMETFSALLAICAGNSPVPGEFPAQRPVTRSFDAFFDLRLNKRLNKQSWGWWFETLSRPLWRHRNVMTCPCPRYLFLTQHGWNAVYICVFDTTYMCGQNCAAHCWNSYVVFAIYCVWYPENMFVEFNLPLDLYPAFL